MSLTTIYTEGRHPGEYIKSEAHWARSRDNAVLAMGSGVCQAGTVLGRVKLGTPAAPAATAGNSGNGTISAVSLGSKARSGAYTVQFTGPAAYQIVNPAGEQLASGVGSTYADPEIGFTFTPGATAMAAGDSITITVPNGSLKLVPQKAAATDGSQAAAAILYANYDATGADVPVTITARDTEVFGQRLTYDNSVSASPTALAAAATALALTGIIIR